MDPGSKCALLVATMRTHEANQANGAGLTRSGADAESKDGSTKHSVSQGFGERARASTCIPDLYIPFDSDHEFYFVLQNGRPSVYIAVSMRYFAQFHPRQQRVAALIQRVITEGLSRGTIVQHRLLRDGQAVSVSRVEVTRDLAIARVHWEPTFERDATTERLPKLQKALETRAGLFTHYIANYLKQRKTSQVEFHCTVPLAPPVHAPRKEQAVQSRRETQQAKMSTLFAQLQAEQLQAKQHQADVEVKEE